MEQNDRLDLSPDTALVCYIHQHMNTQLKEEVKAIRDKMMFEVQRGGQQKATTDQFQCVGHAVALVGSMRTHMLHV